MKFKSPRVLLAAVLICGAAHANTGETYTDAVINSDTEAITHNNVVTVKNSKFTASNGNIHFNAGANLKGGNQFTTEGTSEKLYFGGSSTAEGNNSFNGQIKMNNLVVKSGVQKFENSTPAASMSFSAIGFAADNEVATDAAINVSSKAGNVVFKNDCTITSLEAENTGITIQNTLTVKDSLTLGSGSSITFTDLPGETIELYEGRRIYKGDDGRYAIKYNLSPKVFEIWVLSDDGKSVSEKITEDTAAVWELNWKANEHRPVSIVSGIQEAKIVFEIDSINELMDSPSALMTLAGDADTMLNVADGVDMSNAKVELLFTEKALAELSASEGPVTLNLNKVTNLENIELSLAVEESFGKSAEEVFGTTSVTTGAAGSADNQFTITVPEPTTATLSLLALCGLCARRRRK